MRAEPSCPRCGQTLHAPSLWSSAWTCDNHGTVQPLQPTVQPSAEVLHSAVGTAAVPVWMPWPLPQRWLVTGLALAGDERTPGRAVAVACSGPAPLGGPCDALIVAEEPGIGLGAHFAGLDGLDGGPLPDNRPPDAKVQVDRHPTALWSLDGGPDRAIYVGEASGCWLWLVLWPETAGFLLVDEFVLTDLREVGHDLEVPFGALSPRLGH